MQIERVTITGLDDNVDPVMVDELTDRFEYVEWGILLSDKKKGLPRYISDRKLAEITSMFAGKYSENFSAHLCGSLSDRLIEDGGESYLHGELIEHSRPDFFTRLQLNAYPDQIWEQYRINKLASNLFEKAEIILPIPNDDTLVRVRYNTFLANVNFLHDRSRGKGIVPDSWPESTLPGFVGFAGGISPDNVRRVLDTLCSRGDDRFFWIDMETEVRTDDRLDHKKVEQVLTITGEFL